MVRNNFSVSSVYLWKKSEKRKKTKTQNFNFKKGLFVAPLPKGLGLYVTSLENNAQAYFFSSDSRMQAQFPLSVRISKCGRCGLFPFIATLSETFFTGLNKQKLCICISVK